MHTIITRHTSGVDSVWESPTTVYVVGGILSALIGVCIAFTSKDLNGHDKAGEPRLCVMISATASNSSQGRGFHSTLARACTHIRLRFEKLVQCQEVPSNSGRMLDQHDASETRTFGHLLHDQAGSNGALPAPCPPLHTTFTHIDNHCREQPLQRLPSAPQQLAAVQTAVPMSSSLSTPFDWYRIAAPFSLYRTPRLHIDACLAVSLLDFIVDLGPHHRVMVCTEQMTPSYGSEYPQSIQCCL